MAEATLNDLNATLKEINKGIRDSSGESATSRAKAAEQAAERKSYDDAVLGTLKSIQETLGKNFKSLSTKHGKTGGLIAGLLGGLGAGIGAIGKAIMKIGPKFVLGMGSLALGIGAFMLGLGGSAKVAEFVGVDGSSLNTLVSNVFGAFTGVDLVAMGALITAGILIGKKKGGEKDAITGMTALGAGIGGFFVGILAADAISKLADMVGLDGSSLATLITNFTTAFTGTDGAGIETLGTLVVAGSLIGVTKTRGAVISGMAALGAGIASFMVGILGADAIAKLGVKKLGGLDGSSIKNLIQNFTSAFEGQDGAGIKALGALIVAGGALGLIKGGSVAVIEGMAAIGGGLAAFSVGLIAADGIAWIGDMLGLDGSKLKVLMGNLGEGIGGFVGGIGKGVFEKLQDLDAEKLKELGVGIGGIGLGIAAFSAAKIAGGVGAVVEGLSSFFGAESPIDTIVRLSKDKDIDAARLARIGEAIGPLGEGISKFGGFEVNSGFFTGETDLEKFILAIARIGDSEVTIDTVKIKKLGEALAPLGDGMSGFANVDIDALVGYRRTGTNSIDAFFETLAGKNIQKVANANLVGVAAGIEPLGKSMQSFANLDMATIVGNNWTPGKETSFESFLGALVLATDKIKKPSHLTEVATGVSALGHAMQTFKGIDSDKMDFADLFNSLDKGITLNVTSASVGGVGGVSGGTVTDSFNDNRTFHITDAKTMMDLSLQASTRGTKDNLTGNS